jgi:hypothetical protein
MDNLKLPVLSREFFRFVRQRGQLIEFSMTIIVHGREL